jgi:hypothetical protein
LLAGLLNLFKTTAVKTSNPTNWLMFAGERVTAYSDNHTDPINTLVGELQSLLMLKQVVHIVTIVLQ